MIFIVFHLVRCKDRQIFPLFIIYYFIVYYRKYEISNSIFIDQAAVFYLDTAARLAALNAASGD